MLFEKSWTEAYDPVGCRLWKGSRRNKEIPMKAWMTGNVAGSGTFRCTDCDYPMSLDAADELPVRPECGGGEFVRASLFTTSQAAVVDMPSELEDRGWLGELRDGLDEPGEYLA